MIVLLHVITRGTTSQRLGSIFVFFVFFVFSFFFHVAISDSVQWLPYLGFVPGPTRTTSKGLMSLLLLETLLWLHHAVKTITASLTHGCSNDCDTGQHKTFDLFAFHFTFTISDITYLECKCRPPAITIIRLSTQYTDLSLLYDRASD